MSEVECPSQFRYSLSQWIVYMCIAYKQHWRGNDSALAYYLGEATEWHLIFGFGRNEEIFFPFHLDILVTLSCLAWNPLH